MDVFLFYEKDGRGSRYIGEVLELYRGEDAGDLKRSELGELVENWYVSTLMRKVGELGKGNQNIVVTEEPVQNIVVTEELVQNIVMNEELVQNIVMIEELVQNIVMNEDLIPNGVMDEKVVKNSVMGAKIDPKAVMDLSIVKIGGWNILQPYNRKSLEDSKHTVHGTTSCEN